MASIARTCHVVAALVALGHAGCGGEKRKPPTTGGGDAGASADANADAGADAGAGAGVDATSSADGVGNAPTLEPLPAGTKMPGGMKPGSRLVGGGRFVDAEGDKTVYLIERASRDRASVALDVVLELGGDRVRRLSQLRDDVERCRGPSPAGFVGQSLELTDLDGDGVAEVGLAWRVGCGTDAAPVVGKLVLFEGKDAFVVSGKGPLDGVAAPAADQWPDGWLAHAQARYEALATADAPSPPGPAGAGVLTGADFAVITVETPGEPPGKVSYPDLAPLPAPLETELTTRMKELLLGGSGGSGDGECQVGLVSPELVSIGCRRGDTRAAFTYWREVGLPSIDPAELVGADRLKRLCGDGARPRVVFDAGGLRWVPDDNHAAPAGCVDGVAWADMEPASPRARALIAGVSAARR